MSNQKMLAALPLAALFAALMMHQPARAASQEGVVVVRDRDTGKMRAPTAREMQALRPAPTAALRAQPPLSSLVETRPDGSRKLHLGTRKLMYSVVHRAPDGSLVQQCVQGEEAAGRALTGPAPASHKEHSHEDR